MASKVTAIQQDEDRSRSTFDPNDIRLHLQNAAKLARSAERWQAPPQTQNLAHFAAYMADQNYIDAAAVLDYIKAQRAEARWFIVRRGLAYGATAVAASLPIIAGIPIFIALAFALAIMGYGVFVATDLIERDE